MGCPGPRGWFSPEMPSSRPSTPVPHKLLPFLEHREGNDPASQEERLGVGCMGHVSPVSAPSVVPEPPHLLWPQALLHPLVLDAGDLVEQAVAVELEALVELAVRQPLPGEEGEAGLSPRGLGGTQGPAWGSPTHGYSWDCRGRTQVSQCCSGQGAIPATLSSWERPAAVRRPQGRCRGP